MKNRAGFPRARQRRTFGSPSVAVASGQLRRPCPSVKSVSESPVRQNKRLVDQVQARSSDLPAQHGASQLDCLLRFRERHRVIRSAGYVITVAHIPLIASAPLTRQRIGRAARAYDDLSSLRAIAHEPSDRADRCPCAHYEFLRRDNDRDPCQEETRIVVQWPHRSRPPSRVSSRSTGMDDPEASTSLSGPVLPRACEPNR